MPDKAAQAAAKMVEIVGSWPAEEGECKPSQVCALAQEELSDLNYHQCVDILASVIKIGQLHLGPGKGLHLPQK